MLLPPNHAANVLVSLCCNVYVNHDNRLQVLHEALPLPPATDRANQGS